jgi:hypothetical protein
MYPDRINGGIFMRKVFKTAASLVMASAMVASVIPVVGAEGQSRDTLQAAIKEAVDAKKLKTVNGAAAEYTVDGATGSIDLVLGADTDVRLSAGKTTDAILSGDDDNTTYYKTGIASNSASKTTIEKNGVSVTGDFRSSLDLAPVRTAFAAYKEAAEKVTESDTTGIYSSLLPTIPVKGQFVINVVYDNNMQVADKDAFVNAAAGSMYGFNDAAKEIFTDTSRVLKENTVVKADGTEEANEGYSTLQITVEVKAPTSTELQGVEHSGSWANTLVYADLDKYADTLLSDIDFKIPNVTVSSTTAATTYYTESISMSGYITIGGNTDSYISKINFSTEQAANGTNEYKQVKDWEDVSATLALKLRSSSGGGGGGGGSYGGTSTSSSAAPSTSTTTLAPGETATPNPDGSTPAPDTTLAPGETATPNPDGTTPAPGGTTPGQGSTTPGSSGTIFVPSNSKVPSALNGEDHMVYVIGYPEGDVRPLRSISREEVATIFYRLLTTEKRDSIYTKESSFSDVLKSRWSNKAIATMANGGYILGDAGASTFRPADAITRGEMAAIVTRFLDGPIDTGAISSDFSDIGGHWAATAIEQGVKAGWLTGYEDGTFKADQLITRAEAMTVINRMLVRYADSTSLIDGYVQWPDNPTDAWYYYNVIEATNSHTYNERTFATSADYYEKWGEIVTNWVWGEFKTAYEDPDEIDKQ